MKPMWFVISCLVVAVIDGAAVKPVTRSFKSDDDYASGPSGGGSAIYPDQTGVRYPSAVEEEPTSGDHDSHPYAQSQPLENPSYDPQLYQNFVPQENVQQYVSSYAGHHPFGPPSGHGGIDPYSIHGPTGYSMAPGPSGPYAGIPYGPGFPGGPGAFTVQSGYEGFLVPSVIPPPPPPPFQGAFGLLRNLMPMPNSLISLLMRSGGYIFNSLAVVLFGGAVTTALCTLTPLCTITFAALPLLGLRDTTTALQKALGQEITSERVARAAEFVGTALVKYQTLQAEQEKQMAVEKALAGNVETEKVESSYEKKEN